MKINLNYLKKKIKPLVSVILPTYNRGEKCNHVIKDVLEQTYDNLELILINDGSNTTETKIIEDYLFQNKDFRIKYIKQENKGLAKSLNIGLEKSEGDYITWLSDDNKICQKYIEMLLAPRVDFSYSNYTIVHSNGIRQFMKNKCNNVYEIINRFMGMASFLWKREVLNEIGGFNETLTSLCEDHDYEIRTFLATKNIRHIEESLIDYYDNGDYSEKYFLMKKTDEIVKLFYNIYISKMILIENFVIYFSEQPNKNFFTKYVEDCFKINICNVSEVYFEDNILFVPSKYKKLVSNLLIHSTNRKKIKHIFKENIDSESFDGDVIKKIQIPTRKKYDISIVMSYFNRKDQIINTLDNFENKYKKYKFEVIIVDDNSKEDEKLNNLIKKYSFDIKLITITAEEKRDRTNPCSAYNKGFSKASGKIIIIQNPECYHVGNILEYTLKNMKEEDYFSYSCFTANTKELTIELLNSENIFNKIQDKTFLARNQKPECDLNWYNHPTKIDRNTGYHFCSAIYKSKLDLIQGFDERFSNGSCFDDDELLLAIKYNLRLNIKIIPPEKCFVIHQFHTRSDSFNIENKEKNEIKKKWLKNKKLFEDIKIEHEKSSFQYPKILHLYWDGSPLSYLNYLTVLSFNNYHQNWKIVIYMPIKKTENITWKSHEQKLRYTGKCYLDDLKYVKNVSIQKVDLDKIGFKNDASEVIKSDYFRYYILHKHGGVWGDFDIIFTDSIEKKMSFVEDIVIFRCFKDYYYYPIGFFIAQPNNKFFKYLMEESIKNYDPNEYQSIGAVMWNKLFPSVDDIYKKNLGQIKICDHEFYLPWAWNELDEFLEKEENILPRNNIGIHWFNGATKSKKYAIELEKRIQGKFIPTCYLDKFVQIYFEKKISIVMAYYNKKEQIFETIKRIDRTQYNKNKIEIIIVDDCSKIPLRNFIEDLRKETNIDIKLIEVKNKIYFNPCYAYNLGFKEANGDIIIIQNPEVMYVGDCIDYVFKNLKERDWLSFNCYGLGNFEENEKMKEMSDDEIFSNINIQNDNIGGNTYFHEHVGGWVNHSKIHFVAYHYCAAIYKKDLDEQMGGGFFDNYKEGICFDDNDFINYLVYNNFIFKTSEFKKNKPFVIHQYHEKSMDLDKDKAKELWEINQKIFFERCDKINFPREVDIATRDKKFNPQPVILE
jgi:glycosyltransferase involved in cell wall biosynthesis